jgi:hypothetical protein
MKPRVNLKLNTPTAAGRVGRERRRALQARVADSRKAISREFRETFLENRQLARLALNEAEAIAWQTGLPHLFFPELAEEKVREVASWSRRQRSLRNRNVSAGTLTTDSAHDVIVATE